MEPTNFQIAVAMMIERNMSRRCANKYWVLKIQRQVTSVTWPIQFKSKLFITLSISTCSVGVRTLSLNQLSMALTESGRTTWLAMADFPAEEDEVVDLGLDSVLDFKTSS